MAKPYPPDDAPGMIYLIHFSARTKEGHQHYLGWSADVEKRFARHKAGRGAQETRKAVADGLKLTLAQTWSGTPLQERRIKDERKQVRRGFACLCPFCGTDDDLAAELVRGMGPATLKIKHVEGRRVRTATYGCPRNQVARSL
jgi:predicted GIY-YIG superfamily endonuclease